MHFRKKPVVIEAFQMTEERRTDNRDWPNWLNLAWNEERGAPGSVYPTEPGTGDGTISIMTLEGEHLVSFGDWIIRGVKGELYPCKPDIFEMTYEIASPLEEAEDDDEAEVEEYLATVVREAVREALRPVVETLKAEAAERARVLDQVTAWFDERTSPDGGVVHSPHHLWDHVASDSVPRRWTVAELNEGWDERETVRMRYGSGETGWARSLGDGLFAVSNVPLAEGLNYMDIVTLIAPPGGGSGLRVPGHLHQRVYPRKTYIEYPKDEAQRWFGRIREGLKAGDLVAEGMVAGTCVVPHADDRPAELLAAFFSRDEIKALRFETVDVEPLPTPSNGS